VRWTSAIRILAISRHDPVPVVNLSKSLFPCPDCKRSRSSSAEPYGVIFPAQYLLASLELHLDLHLKLYLTFTQTSTLTSSCLTTICLCSKVATIRTLLLASPARRCAGRANYPTLPKVLSSAARASPLGLKIPRPSITTNCSTSLPLV
jgi:hypothetical protein